jgi:hypothetical protein
VPRRSGCVKACRKFTDNRVRVSVVLLRRAGLRLRAGELGAPLVGDLRVSDAGATSFKRPTLVAQLWAPTHSATDRPLGLPLFDPSLVHMDASSFSLAGLEISHENGRMREHAQVWRCRLTCD